MSWQTGSGLYIRIIYQDSMFFKWKATEKWLTKLFCFGKSIHGKIEKIQT